MTATFDEALRAWQDEDTGTFTQAVARALADLGTRGLPLQAALRISSYALDAPIEVTVLRTESRGRAIEVRAGIFYTGIIAGCSCADDPTPVTPQNEYCEILLTIDRHTAKAGIVLLEQD
ncbi:hypothetical protein [Acidihalobacter prosperus]|uniref:Uncharacterized protein n=1 Tax=Acidihalobacter prosperus TaxID=160660 RepID=A0A1A6C234_9GAMM|nr:hypothetical protein [Acidihalobacter prosperus]OBS08610.1 hypothetical protein Thpro_022860 [Acidihalobacter prosperus]